MRALRVMLLVQEELVPPVSLEGLTDKEIAPWKTEYDVAAGLEELGHTIEIVGAQAKMAPIRDGIRSFKPHIVFSLLEEFASEQTFVPYIIGYLELIGQAYTGCNPVGMMFSNDKALQRKILRHHRIPVPDFMIVRWGSRVKRPKRLGFPLIVKSLTIHGSTGISQASVVYDDEELTERVIYVHEQIGTDAIVEQFIPGRELYMGVVGNQRLQTFPVWEMHLPKLRDGAPRIATEKIKWDLRYQKKVGVRTAAALDLPDGLAERIARITRRAYRALEQTGYARMDYRLSDDGSIYLIESNPNPQLSFGEDFAESAEAGGLSYPALLQRIISLGLRASKRRRHEVAEG